MGGGPVSIAVKKVATDVARTRRGTVRRRRRSIPIDAARRIIKVATFARMMPGLLRCCTNKKRARQTETGGYPIDIARRITMVATYARTNDVHHFNWLQHNHRARARRTEAEGAVSLCRKAREEGRHRCCTNKKRDRQAETEESIPINVARRIIKVATFPGHHRVDAGRSRNP